MSIQNVNITKVSKDGKVGNDAGITHLLRSEKDNKSERVLCSFFYCFEGNSTTPIRFFKQILMHYMQVQMSFVCSNEVLVTSDRNVFHKLN